MIVVSVRHRFGSFVLDAGFTAPVPGVTAIFGPSGCGKSTLLAAVAGLLRPQAGRIAFDGDVMFNSDRGICVAAERRRCGVVFQDARLFPHLSVLSNLRYGMRRAPASATGPELDEVVDLLGIAHALDRRPAGLSGGERQRVALGRALLSRPRLLLMDEPLAALDAARKAEVLPFLARIRDRLRIPLLYVTHSLDEVDRLAAWLVLMQDGRVVASGSLEDLSTRTDLPLLSRRRDAGVVLGCIVQAHDPARGLTTLRFAGGTFILTLAPDPLGAALRVRVRARDVSVAIVPPHGLSMQNVLPVVLEAIEPAQPHQVTLRLRCGESVLLASVTRDTVSRLSLTPGQELWALVKSVTIGRAGEERVSS